MRLGSRVSVIIPALNEAQAIGHVIAAIPDWVDDIIVADNGSTDATPDIARAAGATVVIEPQRGYGIACQTGLAQLREACIVVFLDGDFSDTPGEMTSLVDPIARGGADLVIGSRVLGNAERGALMPQQLFGNWLACWLMRALYGANYTDLGPFRAIRRDALDHLGMTDRSFGWTVEMQLRAHVEGLSVHEVPVSYRERIGKSKISGTVLGSLRAGTTILRVIFSFNRRRST